MSITITGGAGFLGAKLARALAARGASVVLCDMVAPARPPPNSRVVVGALEDTLDEAITADTKAVVHLACVASGGSEQDFDLGYRVNVDGLVEALERCRSACAAPPKFVFTSSLAVFGARAHADDASSTEPQNSYGAQKAIGELLVHDYSRKGFVDGRTVRLPTISVRPGAPNAAASGFASGILREPLSGEPSVCPMPPETPLWLASPNSALRSMLHALDVDASAFEGGYRCVNAPGITCTVAEMMAGLERHGGDPGLVTFQPDPAVAAIVGSWPYEFDTAKAARMGFPAADSIDETIRAHVEDELGGIVGGEA